MEKAIQLAGIFDMHVHTAPDLINRNASDLALVDEAVQHGVRAIVIKGHHVQTVARAQLCNLYNKKMHASNRFEMFGGLVLNREAGGFNAKAVDTALKLGAKEIWMPTVDAANELEKRGKTGGLSILDRDGQIKPEIFTILQLIKEYDAVLGTGHLSAKEILLLSQAAHTLGLKKVLITHPEYWIVDLSLSFQKTLLQQYHVIFERCAWQPLKNGQWIRNDAKNAVAIKCLGSASTILSTDCGNPATPPWHEAMQGVLDAMTSYGIKDEALFEMTRKNPAMLLNISL